MRYFSLFDEAFHEHLPELLVLMDPARELIQRIAAEPVTTEQENELIGYGVIYGMPMLRSALERGIPLASLLP